MDPLLTDAILERWKKLTRPAAKHQPAEASAVACSGLVPCETLDVFVVRIDALAVLAGRLAQHAQAWMRWERTQVYLVEWRGRRG